MGALGLFLVHGPEFSWTSCTELNEGPLGEGGSHMLASRQRALLLMSWHYQPQQWAFQDNWIHSSNVVWVYDTFVIRIQPKLKDSFWATILLESKQVSETLQVNY